MYKENERGKIKYKERSLQVKDYSGVRIGNITPSDIDGFIDYKNKQFVFIELKMSNAPFEDGQRWALERLCDATQEAKIDSIVFVVEHNAPIDEEVDMAQTELVEYRKNGTWRKPRKYINLADAVNAFLKPP